jgi:hypothetical protein
MGGGAYTQNLTQMLNNYSIWMQECNSYNMNVQVYTIKGDARTPYYMVDIIKKKEASLTMARNINYLITPDYSLICDNNRKKISVKGVSEELDNALGYKLPELDSSAYQITKSDKGTHVVFELQPVKPDPNYSYMTFIFNKNGRLKSIKYGLDMIQNNGYNDIEIEYSYRDTFDQEELLSVNNYLKISRKEIALQEQYTEYELFNNMGYVNR